MKHSNLALLCVAAFLVLSCGGSLSDEQRKKFREGMEQNTLKRVTPAQLTEVAFAKGRDIAAEVAKRPSSKRTLDSLQTENKVKIFVLEPGNKLLLDIEQQIVEAYTAGSDSLTLDDNVQLLGDSILYTKPIMKTNKDGSTQFSYALGIRLSRKQLVLSIKD